MKKLSKENKALLRACAILDNVHYFNAEFIRLVCKELEVVAFRRGLKGYFEANAAGRKRVCLDVDSNPYFKK